jgi:hypothetical protein
VILTQATLDELVEYLLVNPDPTSAETGEILINILGRMKLLEAQNKSQRNTLECTTESLKQLIRSRNKSRQYARRRRTS